MCYADAHVAIMESTCTELPRRPWGTGGVVRAMTVRRNGKRETTKNGPGIRDDFRVAMPHVLQPPEANIPES